MGHTLKWGTLPPKGSYRKLLQLSVLTGLFYFCTGTTQKVTKMVKDVAVLSCGYNISTDELMRFRIYWQKHDEMVLAVIFGKVEVWPKYENRTFTDTSNALSIVILALRLSDNGTYTCVIQKKEKGSYKLEHINSVMLLVRADFPVPSITALGNPSTNIKRIICSTSGGFPEPHLFWLENGKELNATNTSVSQDPETGLYTINSELDFNVESNHSFMCLVKYGDLTVSQIFNWQKLPLRTTGSFRTKFGEEAEPPSPSLNPILYCLIILLSIFGITAVIQWQRKRHAARQGERRRNGENMEMERISGSSLVV